MTEDAKLSDEAERILVQFPGPVVMTEDRATVSGGWLGAMIFVAISATIIYSATDLKGLIIGWMGVVFFGFIGIQVLVSSIPRWGNIVLDKDRMTINYGFFRWNHQWKDISDISVFAPRPYAQCVIFNSRAATHSLYGFLNRMFSAGNSFIPSLYGIAPEEMVRLLSLWQGRVLRDKCN